MIHIIKTNRESSINSKQSINTIGIIKQKKHMYKIASMIRWNIIMQTLSYIRRTGFDY